MLVENINDTWQSLRGKGAIFVFQTPSVLFYFNICTVHFYNVNILLPTNAPFI